MNKNQHYNLDYIFYDNQIFKDFTDGTSTIFDDYLKFFIKKDFEYLADGIFTLTELTLKFSLETENTVAIDSYVEYLNLLNYQTVEIKRSFECLLSEFDRENYIEIFDDLLNKGEIEQTDLKPLDYLLENYYSDDLLEFEGEYFEKYHDLPSYNLKGKNKQILTGEVLDNIKKSKMKFTHEDIKNLVNYSLKRFGSEKYQVITNMHFCKQINGKVFVTSNGEIPNSKLVGNYIIKYLKKEIKKSELYNILYIVCNKK